VLFAVDPKGTPRLHELQPELDGKGEAGRG
jgi:hypothetical protein